MPGLAVIATLPSHATVSKTLTVGPYNLSMSSHNPGVPIESVHVVESGPGAVSSMEFSIIDLGTAVVMDEGYAVEFWDVARQGPIFKGFVQTWSYGPLPVGRAIDIRCTGIDAVLDWVMVPSLTIPFGTNDFDAIQSVWGAAAGVGVPLNVTSSGSGASNGTTTNPIVATGFQCQYAVVISNATLRDALQAVFDSLNLEVNLMLAWVDMWGGLRTTVELRDGTPTLIQDDFVAVVIDATAATGPAPNDIDYAIDAGGVPHQVYVTGSNAAGTGLVTDGTGLPGPIASLSDSTSDTATKRDIIGRGYLSSLGSSIRASVTLENHDPVIGPPNVNDTMERAGSIVTLTDAAVGVTAVDSRIYSISKTFLQNGNEDWVIAFGGQRKSAIRSTRRLTRDTRS